MVREIANLSERSRRHNILHRQFADYYYYFDNEIPAWSYFLSSVERKPRWPKAHMDAISIKIEAEAFKLNLCVQKQFVLNLRVLWRSSHLLNVVRLQFYSSHYSCYNFFH